MISGGKRGHCPPIFQPTRKGGGGLTPPPKYLVPQQKLIAQRAGKCRKMPENARKCPKMPENAGKRRKTQKNAANMLAVVANLLQNTGKCRKTPENAGNCWKTPENAGKRRKYCELAISLRGSKYLGRLKKPAPFSGLLKLIVDHNWGATAPFPP